MKKEYLKPRMQVVICLTGTMVCDSGVKSKDKDIDYGGYDEDGSQVPGSRRRRHDVWEDEEEELDEEFDEEF